MGRPQKPIDPERGDLADFAADLRILRDKAGLTYRAMSRQVHYSVTSLAAAAGGDQLPTLAVTLAYVQACGGDAAEWEQRWRGLTARYHGVSPGAGAGPGPPASSGTLPRSRELSGLVSWVRRPLILGAAAVIIAVIAAVAITLAVRPRGPSAAAAGHHHTPPAGNSITGLGPSLVAGLGCLNTPAHNFFDFDAPGSDGWHRIGGGWTGDGCRGRAEFTRITGFATTWAETADWLFQSPAARHCSLAIYVPDDAEADGIANYDLYNSTNTSFDTRMTTITIDQARHHGQWVAAGKYVFAHQVVDLEITDRGASHATIALSTVRLTCF